MTEFERLVRAIEVQSAAVAREGVRRVGRRIVARAAVELPGVAVVADAEGVRLTAPGLVSRAFGSRRAAPDSRLAGLAL